MARNPCCCSRQVRHPSEVACRIVKFTMEKMMIMDPDDTLRVLRQSILKWEKEPPGTVAEAEAAESATSAAAALDQWLSRGGFLPSAWRGARPPETASAASSGAVGC